ncbi:MAG TPA: DUF3618 domain-containing protein [Ornithinimicrobium sp.]|uniref:DUF3618 domain-containing protein n=1 Tax=Ornithinimicrobium sp. TaxID=1977084 RepID=UPI002B482E8C|nr:DUF3618 domain-containing protein [Ornithinimicrobium sp.]HKJ12293.1 DUF3618 domain-containing protein [Ornithinimicrobium sp.]
MADKQKPRSENEIEADLSATRDRLAQTVDELAFRASPAEIKRRQLEKLRAKGNEVAFDDDGDPRLDLLAVVLAGVSGVALLLGTARRLLHKR